jgi:hypothetical protein
MSEGYTATYMRTRDPQALADEMNAVANRGIKSANENLQLRKLLGLPFAGPIPEALSAPPEAKTGEGDRKQGRETGDIGVFGRVDGTGELHPKGSYISIWTLTKAGEKRNHRVSIGLAENLIAELQGALSSRRKEGADV